MTQEPGAHLMQLSAGELLQALAAGTAAPGGGSATALAGALGAALAAMVARLTVGRTRYAQVENQMDQRRGEADILCARLAALVDADAEAYGRLHSAYKLPRQTAEEQARRAATIQAATQAAVEVPLDVAASTVDVLEILVQLAEQGNRNAAPDAAVGALLSHAALQGALRNARANLSGLRNQAFVNEARARVESLQAAGDAALVAALDAADRER